MVIPVIELKGLEGVVREEVIGSSEEFRSGSHLTALKRDEGKGLLRPQDQATPNIKVSPTVRNKNKEKQDFFKKVRSDRS